MHFNRNLPQVECALKFRPLMAMRLLCHKYLRIWHDNKLFWIHINAFLSKVASCIGFHFQNKSSFHTFCKTMPSQNDGDPYSGLWWCSQQVCHKHSSSQIGCHLSCCYLLCDWSLIQHSPLPPVFSVELDFSQTNSLVTVHLQNSNWENSISPTITSEYPQHFKESI